MEQNVQPSILTPPEIQVSTQASEEGTVDQPDSSKSGLGEVEAGSSADDKRELNQRGIAESMATDEGKLDQPDESKGADTLGQH